MNAIDRRSFMKFAAGAAVAGTSAGWLAQALAQGKITPGKTDVFIVVDVQKCFIPGGSLAVERGDEIVPLINSIAKKFQYVVMTQDWHTADHVSFASQHEGKKPFEMIDVPYGKQV
ncbi:MAG: twin-arginine translocation signal domain-containing protein, partial [Burkholderiales bacterium]|nr:twin-arginine translocation signal domain-containing protein [Burkholderiales bacterium]